MEGLDGVPVVDGSRRDSLTRFEPRIFDPLSEMDFSQNNLSEHLTQYPNVLFCGRLINRQRNILGFNQFFKHSSNVMLASQFGSLSKSTEKKKERENAM